MRDFGASESALFGLAPWEQEAVGLAAHVEYLLKRCWRKSP
jgi:hypothetical protein